MTKFRYFYCKSFQHKIYITANFFFFNLIINRKLINFDKKRRFIYINLIFRNKSLIIIIKKKKKKTVLSLVTDFVNIARRAISLVFWSFVASFPKSNKPFVVRPLLFPPARGHTLSKTNSSKSREEFLPTPVSRRLNKLSGCEFNFNRLVNRRLETSA